MNNNLLKLIKSKFFIITFIVALAAVLTFFISKPKLFAEGEASPTSSVTCLWYTSDLNNLIYSSTSSNIYTFFSTLDGERESQWEPEGNNAIKFSYKINLFIYY